MSDNKTGNQFGSFQGVFIPSILTILGVILFLRLGWVVGQAGIVSTIFIIILSCTITLITGLSISATATNTKVGAGGSYFLISRCFGVEPGAAIGLPLYLAQTLGISFYIVGFAESLKLFFPELSAIVIAMASLALLAVVTFISSNLALKMQIFVFILIVLSLGSFLFGTPLSLDSIESTKAASDNLPFWAVFAIFFPAVTGIEAGISMSGDLKNPHQALPKGTLAAVLVGGLVYILCALKFSQVAPDSVLLNNSFLMRDVALVPVLILVGLWGATLSSSLGAMMGAPRTLQALAKDSIVPQFLSRSSKTNNEPYYAMFVSYMIAAAGILLGDLNAIAALLSMFFLTSYGVLNLVSGFEGLISNPSWRPTFRIPWFISILGAMLCFGAMLMINPGTSFVAFAIIFAVYFLMRKRNLRAKYSDIRTGLVTHFARNLIYSLSELEQDARNWRPHFLVLSGSPKSRFYLIDLIYTITQERGFMTVAAILRKEQLEHTKVNDFAKSMSDFLMKNKIHSLVKVTQSESVIDGARAMVKNYGIGKITPNTIVLGERFRDDEHNRDNVEKVLFTSYRNKKNTIIIRRPEDISAEEPISPPEIVDIWWGGQNNNASLMLTLSHMLMSSKNWRNTKLRLNTIAQSEDQKKGVWKNFSELIKTSRIRASIDVQVESNLQEPLKHICEHSKDSDFVFIGLRTPKEDETVEEYAVYYREILKKTESLPLTIFTLAGEDNIEFHKIFL